MKWEMKQSGNMVAAILRLKKEMANRSVEVGVMGKGDRERGGINADGDGENSRPIGNVELAVIHEYGAPRAGIIPRSFIYSTLHANRTAYAELIGKLINGVIVRRFTVTRGLNLLGMRVANDCKNRIADGAIVQALSPKTIAAKLKKSVDQTIAKEMAKNAKRKKPKVFGPVGPPDVGAIRALIDTGQLKNSITWVVEGSGDAPMSGLLGVTSEVKGAKPE